MNINKNKDTKMAISVFLGILLILGTLNSVNNIIFNNIGFLSLLVTLFLMNFGLFVYLIVRKRISKKYSVIIVLSVIFLLCYCMGIFVGKVSDRTFIVPFQFFLIFNLFLFCSLIKWKLSYINYIAFILSIYNFVCFAFWLTLGRTMPFQFYLENPNIMGSFAFFLLYFSIIAFKYESKRFKKLFLAFSIFVGVFLGIISMARSVWLAFIVMGFVFIIWPKLIKKRKRYVCSYYLGVVLIFLFTIIYSKAPLLPNIVNWNYFIYTHTGKNLLSGRERFWTELIDAIGKRPFWGYGGGVDLNEIAGISLSAHNLYIQIALQVGLIGLFVFVLILGSIWSIFWMNRQFFIVRLSGSFMIAILIHQTFEVCLTQNNMAVGLIQWLILAIGVSESLNNKNVLNNKIGENT